MEKWSFRTFNNANLSPRKRLDILYEKTKFIHVDTSVDVRAYSNIANELLNSAKILQNENKIEESLINYLRYQALVKKLKSHSRYKDLSLGKRAAFNYLLQKVEKNVKSLTEIVLAAYKKVYITMSYLNTENSFEGFQEKRPTNSTVRTFVSTQASERSESLPKDDLIPKTRRIMKFDTGNKQPSTLSMSLMRNSSSLNSDVNYGLRKSIFPTKQVKEFDELHKQRRTLKSHRTVVIPSRVTTAFSYLSLPNTRKNVETVGYLAGKVSRSNMLVITHLLLPPQKGFSDFFEVTESTAITKFLDVNDLMTLGWVHSHPSETPFLSSNDMHYQCIFQSVLPEAIAIVYSAKEMRSVDFNLTPNHGLTIISNCNKKGFHTHPTNQPLTMMSHHAVIDLHGDLTIQDSRTEDTNFVP